ncbi:MAG: OsmC family protein [Woeseiaceae bacterium]|nr:OsmC family protein [Woeseiaceae bacterium]
MQDYPHYYRATASAAAESSVDVTSPGLESIETAPPPEFGGPGDLWSPETLLAAAVANCFILSFRAIARAAKLEWNALSCDVEAVLDRGEDRVTKFTEISERVVLDVPAGTDPAKARRLLDKAEHVCLITNSMTATTTLEAEVRVAD